MLFSTYSFISAAYYNVNNNNNIRNLGLRLIILKEKKYPKLLNSVKKKYKICYNKSMSNLCELINEYENLPDQDKTIIEFILSSIF